MNAEQLNAIKERAANTSFHKTYVKGDPWKGYEVRNEGNGQTIAETSNGTDAEFIAHAYEDVPALVAEVERLQNRCELYEVARRNDGKMSEYKDAEIERLRKALEFYADEENYECSVEYDGMGEPFAGDLIVEIDGGQTAKEALRIGEESNAL